MKTVNVLLAEDNPSDVFLVQQALDKYNIPHVLHLVSDGEHALEFLGRAGKEEAFPCPDLVILDINLPRANGIRILSEIREHELCKDTPTIVYSSSGNPIEKAMAEGLLSRYFRKPNEYDAFLKIGEVILELLREKGSA